MSNNKKNIKSKKVKRPGRGKRRFFRVSIIVLAFLAIIQIILYYYSDPFIRRFLQNKLVKESQGLYKIEFERININLATRGFVVKNLKISPQEAYMDQVNADTVKSYYNIHFPELNVSGIGLLKLYYEKYLEISSVTLKEPEIDFLGSQKFEGLNQHNKVYNDLYPLINQYVKGLVIKQLKFSNGSIILQNSKLGRTGNSTAGDIFITLNGFRLDSTTAVNEYRLLFSDHIDLDIEDYRLKLSDGIHVLEAEEVNLSTGNSTIYGKKIWLLPSMASDSIKNDVKQEFYDVYIPELEITGADIYKAYFENIFNIDGVNLIEPEIRFITKKKFTDMEQAGGGKNLFTLSSTFLDQIYVDTINIEKGRFAISKNIDQQKADILANEISVGIGSFLIDSTSYKDLNRIFYADNLNVDIGNYTMDLADSIHILQAKQVRFSTDKHHVEANVVSLRPNPAKKLSVYQDGNELYDIQVPKLIFDGVDFKKVYNLRDLEFRNLKVNNPIVKMSDFKNKSPRNTQLDEASLYRLIKNYIKSIEVNQIQLTEGSLEYANYKGNKKDTIRAGKIAFTLDNFRLDSIGQFTSNRIFFADHITFTLENYLMKLSDDLHILRASTVGISTKKSQIFANNIQLFPIPVKNIKRYLERSRRSVLYNINIPSLVINGADIRKAYFQRLLNIDDITITQPNVVLNRYTNITRQRRTNTGRRDDLYDLFSDYLRSVNINKMKLNKGVFNVVTNTNEDANTLSQNNISIEATNFVLDQHAADKNERIFYSDEIEVKLDNYVVNLPDSVHVLKTRQLGISTAKSEIYLKSTRLYPISNRLDTVNIPAFYDVEVPNILMKGVDINKLYHQNVLEISQIELDKPAIEIINQIDIKGKNNFINAKRKSRMPIQLKGIKIKNAEIAGGYLALGNLVGNQKKIFSKSNIRLKLVDFLLDSLMLNNNRKILYADNVELNLDRYSMRLPDSIHNITARNIYVSSGNKRITAIDFILAPRRNNNYSQILKNRKTKLLFDLNFPNIELTGIDLERAYLQKNYSVRNAILKNPTVKLTSYKERVKDAERIDPKDILEQLLSKNLKFLNIQQLNFSGGSFELFRANEPKRKGMNLKRISGTVKQFNLNSKSKLIDSRLFYADDIDLKIKDYSYKLPDSLYILKADEIGVSLAKSRIYLNSFKLIPRYGKVEFGKNIGHEKDRMDFLARQVELGNFDFEGYILDDRVKAGVVNIYDFNFNNYRDKRLPFPTDQAPMMPQEWIRSYDQYLKFDLINMHNGLITYEEHIEEGQNPGKIFFDNVEMEVRNITNDASEWRRNDLLSINAEAMLMGKGKVKAWFTSKLSDKQNKFTFNGHIAKMDLTTVNPMLENVAYVSVKSGINDRLDFNMEGNSEYAVGEMRFRYNDLKVTVIKKKTGDKGGFASFLANTFVINNKNPNGKNLRVGEIYFQRDNEKSMFNYLWKSLLSGIKPSLGINDKNKKDKEEKASIK